MERMGEVTAVRGELLEITFCRPSDCEKCNACHGGQKVTTLLVPGQASLGDAALVELPAGTLAQASALAYGLPLAGLLLGAGAGAVLFPANGDVAAVLCGLAGLGAAALALCLTERRRKRDPRWQPKLIEIIPKEQEQ